ncbi:MAG: hypothetical protein PHN56_00850 [Candidatus Nanoarchaeia archaeon]|nr:hypothetical protein [Candidatus Nanoarchaeia archaeon]
MKKCVTDYPIGLLISVLIIFLIVYYGSIEISSFLEMRAYQQFGADVLKIIDSMNYLKESNAMYSFLNIKLNVPKGQSILFDEESDLIILQGYFNLNKTTNNNITRGTDNIDGDNLVNYTNTIIICYSNSIQKCNIDESKLPYTVIFE